MQYTQNAQVWGNKSYRFEFYTVTLLHKNQWPNLYEADGTK